MDHEDYLRSLIDPVAKKGAGAAVAKLTFEQRCAILGADKIGMKRPVIAAAFEIARPTVAYICNSASRHYRNVRKEYEELGRAAFLKKYLTEEYMDKINKAAHDIRAKATDADDKEIREFEANQSGPHRTAKGQEGPHHFWDEFDKRNWNISVEWFDEHHDVAFNGPGWYVVVSGITMATFGAPKESAFWPGDTAGQVDVPPFATSQLALKTFLHHNSTLERVEL